MTSDRKMSANRQNAKRSTGPKTSTGRRRSSCNAIRHGLESVRFNEQIDPKLIDRMVEAICEGNADPSCHLLARIIAESRIFISRVRAARVAAIDRVIGLLASDENQKAPKISSDETPTDCTEVVGVTLSETEAEDRIMRCAAITGIVASRVMLKTVAERFAAGDFRGPTKTFTEVSTLLLANSKLRLLQAKATPTSARARMKARIARLTQSLEGRHRVRAFAASPLDRALAGLIGLERYERRALSKRRRAMRRLAELRS
jgi:hypothetical protein